MRATDLLEGNIVCDAGRGVLPSHLEELIRILLPWENAESGYLDKVKAATMAGHQTLFYVSASCVVGPGTQFKAQVLIK